MGRSNQGKRTWVVTRDQLHLVHHVTETDAGFEMRLKEPLDFYAVTDHAFLMGAMTAMKNPSDPMSRHPDAKTLTNPASRADRIQAFRTVVPYLRPGNPRYREIDDPPTTISTWANIVESA